VRFDVTVIIAFVRYRRGIVGEARRAVHLVPVPIDAPPAATAAAPSALIALCGERLRPRDAELLTGVGGMPCVDCIRRSDRRSVTEPLPQITRRP
jgi:hypothetical protein